MRTVPFQSVLEMVANKVLGTADTLSAQQAATLTSSINEHLRNCWERDFWPEWTLTEQRWFRPTWTATTYGAGTEIYHTGTDAYYRATSSVTGTDVPGTSNKWLNLGTVSWLRTIAVDQPGQTPMGTVQSITARDPRIDPAQPSLNWHMGPDAIEFPIRTRLGTSCWVTFRQVPPSYTATPWSATNYAAGARVLYLPTGECYLANASTADTDLPGASAKWTLQPFPACLKTAVALFAQADSHNEDGQLEAEASVRARAEDILLDEWRKFGGQANQPKTYRAVVVQTPPVNSLAIY